MHFIFYISWNFYIVPALLLCFYFMYTTFIHYNFPIVQENTKLNLDFKELQKLHEIDSKKLKRRINILGNEINVLENTLNKIKTTIKTFISWVCRKFFNSSENQILRDFQNETGTNTNLIKLINLKPNLKVKTSKENNLER